MTDSGIGGTMVLDDLHERIEKAGLAGIQLDPEGVGWRCQLYADGGMRYGEATGHTIAEAIEGALDDMDEAWANRNEADDDDD